MKIGSRLPVLLVLITGLFASWGEAAVIGDLTTGICLGGGGVTVNTTTIDWMPTVSGGDGCIVTGTDTSVSYSGGTLGPSETGRILDLTTSTSFPVTDFMTFTGHPTLHFDLAIIGPGPASTACPDTFNDSDPICAIVAGSPFVVRPGSTGATVELAVRGTARDASSVESEWIGKFSANFAGKTPADLQAQFEEFGSITSSHSGDFTVSFIPEPSTWTLMMAGGGLVLLARLRLTRQEKRRNSQVN
jgi:hypothetical protein